MNKFEYKNLTPFKWFVLENFPFIEADFDALTEWQLFCKLGKEMNKIINSENTLGTQMENVTNAFIELENYVNNYFDNLDVQDEINNKLNEMVESGVLESIISEFLRINSLLSFDTVTNLKTSINIINGSFARTLGYHTINDGGSALYKIRNITNNDVVDESFIISLNDPNLIAELIIDDNVNVKQLGAYGNNNNDDTSIFNKAISYCLSNNKTLYCSDGIFKITTIDVRSINVNLNGTINNSLPIIIGAKSNGSTVTKTFIYKCNDVTIEGAKKSDIEILYSNQLKLYANGDDSNISSIAYCKIKGIECNHLTIYGENNGWINENAFYIKRSLSGITISGDLSYIHNNNRIENICIEGSTSKIKIDCGHSNYISYRGEKNPILEFNNNSELCHGNIIVSEYNNYRYDLVSSLDTNHSNNLVHRTTLNNFNKTNLFELNKFNVKNLNANVFLNNNNKIVGNWINIFESEPLEINSLFTIFIKSNEPCFRAYLELYNNDMELIQGNVGGGGVVWISSESRYGVTLNVSSLYLNYYPTENVKYIKFIISTGGNSQFEKLNAYMYTPLNTTDIFTNKISINRKYSNQSPANLTSLNQTWVAGDVVYNSNPSNNIFAWVCTTGGTGSSAIWKEVQLSS